MIERVNRRDLLKLGLSAGAAYLMPGMVGALMGAEPKGAAAAPGSAGFDWKRTLVLIELRGGNDGLNMVCPYSDPLYAKLRPKLAHDANDVVKLDKDLGLHPVMKDLEKAWTDKDMAIALGLGYPNPNRSHFRSIDIWHGGSKSDEMAHDGWIARVLTEANKACPASGTDATLADGIVFGYSGTVGHAGFGPLYGDSLRNLIMDSPREFVERARNVPKAPQRDGPNALKRLLAVENDIAVTADQIEALEGKASDVGKFPQNGLGRHLANTAKLIAAGARVPVFKLTLDGFDTHANQKPRHEALMKELATSVAAFRAAMIKAKKWDDVLLCTYSEFGRRVPENDSGGTDHGTAAPHVVMGGKVRGGFYGEQPSLGKLDYGDLVFTTDYRSLYLTIAQEWWGWKQPFLSDRKIAKGLGIVKA